MKTIQIQKRRRKTMNKKEVEGTEIQRSYIPRLIEVGFTIKEIAEMMGFGIIIIIIVT